MFTVLNSYRDNNTLLYAIRDFASGNDIEIVSEEELKLLVDMHLDFKDINDNIVSLSGDTLNIQVDDITDQINEDLYEPEDDSDVDDFYKAYEEDDEEEDDEEDDYDDSEADDFYENYTEDEESEEGVDFDESEIDDFYKAYEEEEDDDPEGSVVSKLYENLTEEQIKILKRYYLWYSQRLFNDAQKDPTLGLKNAGKIQAKKNALNQLRGDGDWRYAGFLDTGSKRAGYTCTLGHPIRYMHLAWDITKGDIETSFFGEDYSLDYESVIASNDCVIFGIKCIGDFFEVDSDCIRSLQAAQRESLRDMALMYDFYVNDTVEKAKESFKFMDEVVKVVSKKDIKGRTLNKDYVPIMPLSVAAFYTQFREQGMIPPKSLVQTIRSCLMGWTNGESYFSNKWTGTLYYPKDKFYSEVLPVALNLRGSDKELCSKLTGNDIRYDYNSGFITYVTHFIYVAFAYEICGVYKFDAETNKDEGGRSKPVKRQLAYHYNCNTGYLFKDLAYNIDTAVKLLKLNSIISQFTNSYRTENFPVEIIVNSSSTSSLKVFMCQLNQVNLVSAINDFDKETGSDLFNILYLFTNLNLAFKQGSYKRRQPFTSVLYSTDDSMFELQKVYTVVEEKYSEFLGLYEKFLKFIEARNEKFIAEYRANEEQKKLEERKKLEEEEKAHEEKKQEQANNGVDSPMKLVEFLKNQDLTKLGSSWDLPKSILETVKKSGNEPSDRQFYHLKKLYKEISGFEYNGVESSSNQKIDLQDRKDLKEAIDFILANENYIPECIDNLKNASSDVVKFKDILQSILKYGKISSRQLNYAEAAKTVYDLNK